MICADALRAGGASVDLVIAHDDAEIDAATKPVEAGDARLIVAAATDGEVRAVIRRLVRRYAPPPSARPEQLRADRTVFDLPPLAVLPLVPAIPPLISRLGLPTDPYAIAAAVLGGKERRIDLFRTDNGSVTLHGCLLGGVDAAGNAVIWRARIEVDDMVLADGTEPLVACSIHNIGPATVDGLPLILNAEPDDGVIDVAIAVPTLRPRLLRRASPHFEVRRARGRAVNVTPHADSVQLSDDGVAGLLTRRRTWWMERGAWAAYVN